MVPRLTLLINILSSGLKPKLSEVQKYVRPHVAERWEDVGYALCLADSDDGKRMDEIKEEKKGEANSCFNEIMKLWLRSGSSCTWSTLIAAIKSVWGLEAVGAQIEAQILAKSKQCKGIRVYLTSYI